MGQLYYGWCDLLGEQELENKINELRETLTDVRVEQARHDGILSDLTGWREQFQRDIKDTLNKMDNRMEKELFDMGNNIKGLNEKMDSQNKELHQKIDSNNNKVLAKLEDSTKEQTKILQKATGKLPPWAYAVASAFVILTGWGILIMYYSLHK